MSYYKARSQADQAWREYATLCERCDDQEYIQEFGNMCELLEQHADNAYDDMLYIRGMEFSDWMSALDFELERTKAHREANCTCVPCLHTCVTCRRTAEVFYEAERILFGDVYIPF